MIYVGLDVSLNAVAIGVVDDAGRLIEKEQSASRIGGPGEVVIGCLADVRGTYFAPSAGARSASDKLRVSIA